MTTPSHDDDRPPPRPCPWWCADQEFEDTPDHPERHESRTFSVDAEIPGLYPVTLFFHLVQPVTATVGRIVLGQGDDDYVTLGSAAARSLAAALEWLADSLEGLVSL